MGRNVSPYGEYRAGLPPVALPADPWVGLPHPAGGALPIAAGFSEPAGASALCDPGDYDCKLYTPFASIGYLGGTTPSRSVSNLFLPLLQSHSQLLYADVRGLYNEYGAWQGSFGGGYRQIVADSVIVGGYTFYDYRSTESDARFQQLSFGAEALTINSEARLNGYFPTSGSTGGPAGLAGAILQNGNILLLGQQLTNYRGFDAEAGSLIYANDSRSFELRAFFGGYSFDNQAGGPDLTGVASRIETRLYDLPWLGEGSRLEAGVITTYDDVRDVEVTGLILVRIALGRSDCPRGLTLLERRMLDRVVRQSDLLVSSGTAAPAEAGLAQVNGHTFTSVVTVQPGDNLQTLVEGAPADSLVVVNGGGAHYLVPNGVTLQPGQTVLGSGTPVQVVGATTGRLATLTIPGPTPVIERPNILGPNVTAASGSSLIGVDVQGGETGVLVNGVNNVAVENVNIYEQCCDGFSVTNAADVALRNVTIHDTQRFGIMLQTTTNVTIENVTLIHNEHTSLIADQGTNTVINGLTVDAANTGHDPLLIRTQNNGTFTNITINNSAFNAFVLEDSAQMTITGLTVNNTAGSGAVVLNGNNVALTGLNINNAGVSGLVVNGGDSVTLNASVFNQLPNVIEFFNAPTNLSGGGNNATNFTLLSTGAVGSGSYLFDTPNASVP